MREAREEGIREAREEGIREAREEGRREGEEGEWETRSDGVYLFYTCVVSSPQEPKYGREMSTLLVREEAKEQIQSWGDR